MKIPLAMSKERILLLFLFIVLIALLVVKCNRSEDEPIHQTEQATPLFLHEGSLGIEFSFPQEERTYKINLSSDIATIENFPMYLCNQSSLQHMIRSTIGLRGLLRDDLLFDDMRVLFESPTFLIHIEYASTSLILEVAHKDASGESWFAHIDKTIYQIPDHYIRLLRNFPTSVLVDSIPLYDERKRASIEVLLPGSDRKVKLIETSAYKETRIYTDFFPYAIAGAYGRPLPVNPEIVDHISPFFRSSLSFVGPLETRSSIYKKGEPIYWEFSVLDAQQNHLFSADLWYLQGKSYMAFDSYYREVNVTPLFSDGFDLLAPYLYMVPISQVKYVTASFDSLNIDIKEQEEGHKSILVNSVMYNQEVVALVYRELISLMYSQSISLSDAHRVRGEYVGTLIYGDSIDVFELNFYQHTSHPQILIVFDSFGGSFLMQKRELERSLTAIEKIVQSL